VSRQIPVQAGFDRLLQHYEPWGACELLNTALLKNDVRLWRDGALLSPADIRGGDLYAHAELEPDGRWLCTIETGQPRRGRIVDVDDSGKVQVLIVALPRSVWEVDAEGIAALLPSAPGKRGRKSVQNWTAIVDGELQNLRHKDSTLLKNLEDLSEVEAHLVSHLKREIGQAPTTTSSTNSGLSRRAN
jgi:hypothetical protein